VFVTTVDFSISPFNRRRPKPLRWTLHQVAYIDFADAADIAAYVQFLDEKEHVQVDWASFEHDESTRDGSVQMTLVWDAFPAQVSTMSWGYEPLDDPDNAEPLPIPVDYRTETVGALTPAQREKFWSRVNEEVEPFQVLDAVLERFGLTPTEHDEADVFTLRQVLALDWYRNFPTLDAGERALDSEPDLTDVVLGQVTLMASRCGLEGEAYELFEIFVAEAA